MGKPKMDFMVDLETMGNGHDAAVVQIGAVRFGIDTGNIYDELSVNVSLEEEMELGFRCDAITIKWWMEQERKTWIHSPVPSEIAFDRLAMFLGACGVASRVWSHSTFDAPIIFHHFKVLGIPMPQHYRWWMDLRTLSMLGKGVASIPDNLRPVEAHDALADAKYQAAWAANVWRSVTKK